jgi:hypothetical protein
MLNYTPRKLKRSLITTINGSQRLFGNTLVEYAYKEYLTPSYYGYYNTKDRDTFMADYLFNKQIESGKKEISNACKIVVDNIIKE